MPNDNRNNPPKTGNKKVNELPPKKGGNTKDEQVKGGMMREQLRDAND
jgi:hypothetical protein